VEKTNCGKIVLINAFHINCGKDLLFPNMAVDKKCLRL
jgi:hypothetical protein